VEAGNWAWRFENLGCLVTRKNSNLFVLGLTAHKNELALMWFF
jgi:hypothetical protein